VKIITSEQHKESGKSRQARDNSDAFKILRHITDKNPYEGHEQLRSIETRIETGMIAKVKVNVDRREAIGLDIMQSSILRRIWLNFMALCLVFIGSFTVFTFFFLGFPTFPT
jgi:hypothetical protein